MAMTESDKQKPFRHRRRHMVNFGLQFRYLTIIMMGMLIPMVIVATVLFLVFWQAFSNGPPVPEGVAQFMMPVLAHAALVLLCLMPVVCILILWAAFMLSHRIAGPLLRLEKDLRDMTEKKTFFRIHVRKNDELSSLADAINQFVEGSRKD